MKNLPEINHCIPNPGAWWCCDCKAHTGFDILTTAGEKRRKCKLCERGMFKIGDFQAPKAIALWFAKLLVVCGLVGIWSSWALLAGFWGSAAVFGLVGWSFHHFTKKWSAWCRSQERKTERQLEQEARDHPFQAEYEDSRDFDEWAGQFFSSPATWAMFHKKYKGEWESPVEGGGEAGPVAGAQSSSPPVDLLDD